MLVWMGLTYTSTCHIHNIKIICNINMLTNYDYYNDQTYFYKNKNKTMLFVFYKIT